MPTRNIVLTDQLSAFVDRMVSEGSYQNASEVLREGLRRLQKDEEAWERAKAGVLEGLEQIRRGEFAEGSPEEIFARAKARAKLRHG